MSAYYRSAPSRNRPVLVWIITIWFIIGSGSAAIMLLAGMGGASPGNEEKKLFFSSMTFIDQLLMLVSAVANLAGSILLFRLKKMALPMFTTALGTTVVFLSYNMVVRNLFNSIDGPMLGSMIFNCAISLAIIAYVKRLIRKEVLK
jgi:hypothetical protein